MLNRGVRASVLLLLLLFATHTLRATKIHVRSLFQAWHSNFAFYEDGPIVARTAHAHRIAYVTFAHLKDTSRFERFVFPSLDTWFRDSDDAYYVVLGEVWREAYHGHLCNGNNSEWKRRYCPRLRPIFVDCPEAYYGESPCCKNEKGMLKMHEDHGKEYDWFMYMDDDVYVRREFLGKYIEPLDPSGIMILASGKNGGKLTKLGTPSFRFGNSLYPCSSDIEYMYPWGQPVVYSRGALARAAVGFRLGGLVKQCLEYGVTHDAGNAIFHWMMQFPELRIPFPREAAHTALTHFGSHTVGRTRRNSNDWNFTETETFFQNKDGDDLTFIRHWHNVTGFRSTATYQAYGNPWTWTDVWHTMNVSDCRGGDLDKLGEPYVVFPKPWTKPADSTDTAAAVTPSSNPAATFSASSKPYQHLSLQQGDISKASTLKCPPSRTLQVAADSSFQDFIHCVLKALNQSSVDVTGNERPIVFLARNFNQYCKICSGAWLEFGVFQGGTMKMAHDNLIQNNNFIGALAGFDSFEGLPEKWRDGFNAGRFGRDADFFDTVRATLPPRVELYKGWFQDTIPLFKRSHKNTPAALIHHDGDLFLSTTITLQLLMDRVVPGTQMIFDELVGYPGYEKHEILALWLWMVEHNVTLCAMGHQGTLDDLEAWQNAQKEVAPTKQSAWFQVMTIGGSQTIL